LNVTHYTQPNKSYHKCHEVGYCNVVMTQPWLKVRIILSGWKRGLQPLIICKSATDGAANDREDKLIWSVYISGIRVDSDDDEFDDVVRCVNTHQSPQLCRWASTTALLRDESSCLRPASTGSSVQRACASHESSG